MNFRFCTQCIKLINVSARPSGFKLRCFLSSSARLFQEHTLSPDGTPFQHDIELTGPSTRLPSRDALPIITSRTIQFPHPVILPKQAWLETLATKEDEKLGIVDLHPDIFYTFPRIDVLWWNVYWQKMYKKIMYAKVKTRAEMDGGGRKPWPQKGTGRARHGSIRSPLWIRGGKAFGPRGPKSYFFMLPNTYRVLGLCVALSAKYAQEDLHIVDSLDIPSNDPHYLRTLVESRGWGLSVLFIDDTDIIGENMAVATDQIKEYNVMPLYGLNVHSMLKHEALVLTLPALEKLEEKLMLQLNCQDRINKKFHKHAYSSVP